MSHIEIPWAKEIAIIVLLQVLTVPKPGMIPVARIFSSCVFSLDSGEIGVGFQASRSSYSSYKKSLVGKDRRWILQKREGDAEP